MKYIVVELDGRETIFVFPRMVDHDRMAEALEAIRFGYEHDWSRRIATQGRIVSAGFVDDGRCHGRSETLNRDSRGELDTELLTGYVRELPDDGSKHWPPEQVPGEAEFHKRIARVLKKKDQGYVMGIFRAIHSGEKR